MPLDINNISECKAYAYDLLVRIEATQKELQAVNQQIVKLSQPTQTAPKPAEVEETKVAEVKTEETK